MAIDKPAHQFRVDGAVTPFVRVCRERGTPRAKTYHDWKDGFAGELRKMYDSPQPLFPDGEVLVTIAFQRWRKSGDIDNLAKGVLDACKGILWKDDAQVSLIVMSRDWCGKGDDSTTLCVQELVYPRTVEFDVAVVDGD